MRSRSANQTLISHPGSGRSGIHLCDAIVDPMHNRSAQIVPSGDFAPGGRNIGQ